MDALRFTFPLVPDAGGPPAVPTVDDRSSTATAPPPRVHAWLSAVAHRLRARLGDFPDAVWLTTPAGTHSAACDERNHWTVSAEPRVTPERCGSEVWRLPCVHEVADSAHDPIFADHPTAARWPMARRLCRLAIDDGRGPAGPSVLMLIGSLPGRLSEAQRLALLDWTPAASAMLALVLEHDARR